MLEKQAISIVEDEPLVELELLEADERMGAVLWVPS